MRYLSVTEIAKKWDVSERSVRNYCAKGRVNGALDLCQYFGHKKLKVYADFSNSSSSFCCGVI